MPFRAVLGTVALVLSLGITQTALGQVIYSDGLTHTIPGDPGFTNGQSISLQAASGLVVNTSAVVDGGDNSGNQSATGDVAISGLAGTSITHNNGDVTGGEANVVADGLTTNTPMTSTGGAAVSTSGSYIGTGGNTIGGYASADGAFGVTTPVDFVTATGGAGLALSNGATANLQNGNFTGGETLAWTANVLVHAVGGAGLNLNNSGPVSISSGTFIGGLGWSENFNLTSGDATGQGGSAIDVHGTSNLTINGGYFEGGGGSGIIYFTTEQGTGIGGAAMKITGPATVTINDGSFLSGSAGAGTNPPTVPITTSESAITVVGDASSGNLLLTINGGTFDGLYGLQTLGTSPNAANARIDIFGGDLDTLNPFDLSLANPDITTTIFGSDFLLDGNPVGFGPISALTGTLEGLLADNSSFEWDFERFNGAPLVLAPVPEPTSLALTAIAMPFLIRRRRD